MKRCCLILLMFALPLLACAQQFNLIPYPGKMEVKQGHLQLRKNTSFYVDKGHFTDVINYLNEELGGHQRELQ